MTDAEYKSKINTLRSRYISALEKGVEGIEDSIETLQEAQSTGKTADRIKAAETLITKVSTEIQNADKKEHNQRQLEALGNGGNIPIDAAVTLFTKLAEAFGADTSSLQNVKVEQQTREVNRISPTPSEEPLPFHPPESDRTADGDRKQEEARKQRRRNDFLSTIDQGKGYKE